MTTDRNRAPAEPATDRASLCIIGRWWLLLLVPPAVYIWMLYFEWSILEEDIQRGISLVYGAASALGLVAGILLRRFLNRFVKPS